MSLVRHINVALQGGGAHGAFTWGVLDRLLEDDTIEIVGISGTSAGALNGAALKAGLVSGGRAAAKENLDWLWSQVSEVQDLRMGQWMEALLPDRSPLARIFAAFSPYAIADTMSRIFSPYDYGPYYSNPLRRVVVKFRFDKVASDEGPAFFVSATNVRTGKIRVFGGPEITTEAILASACLPTVFRAIEIRDPATGHKESYWDGGYTGNPALFPLFDPGLPRDILLVNINPLVRREVPHDAQDIQNRINEISFNASLLSELRAINFVRELIAEGKVSPNAMKDVLVHLVADDTLMTELSAETKILPTNGLLARLKAAGRRCADRFLDRHGSRIGHESTVDLQRLFS